MRENWTVKDKSLVSLSPFVGCTPTVADGTVGTLMFLYSLRSTAVSLNLASVLLLQLTCLYFGRIRD